MGIDERVRKAFIATRALSIPDRKVKPVLKHLLKVFDKKWELIEAENYRALIDACFDLEENKEVGDEEGSNSKENEDTKRPSKKLHREPEDRVPTTDNSIQILSEDDDDRGKNLMIADHAKKLMVRSESSRSGSLNSSPRLIAGRQLINSDQKMKFRSIHDITKGTENVKISLVDETGSRDPPVFKYIPQNIAYQNAYVHISLARISDEDCCSNCKGDCLSSSVLCACACETGGEFAYTKQGLLKEEFLDACVSMKKEPLEYPMFFCRECPLEKNKNEVMPEKCSGHLIKKFIKECWRKCGCDMRCGNRIMQRGITCKLQLLGAICSVRLYGAKKKGPLNKDIKVFWTPEGKGWGVRTLQDLPKGSFVCEYVGEILTNLELYDRTICGFGNERHTYPVLLDAGWGSEKDLKDEEAFCLDATLRGNVGRFINHRCSDANLIDIPVEVETPDRHYYHLAFFTTRKVKAFEELSWDYNVDFSDHSHPIKAFQCCCGSDFCRDVKPKETVGSREKASERRSLISTPKQAGQRMLSVKRERE